MSLAAHPSAGSKHSGHRITGWLLPQDDARQALRMRRFLTGAASLLVVVGLMVYCVQTGLMSAAQFTLATGLVALWFAVFYALLRSGLNLRFPDQSLTMEQVVAASAIMYYTGFIAEPARATFLIAALAVFLFGVFRLRTRQLLLIALFDVLAHAAVIFWDPADSAHHGAHRSDLRVEILQLLVMGASLTWFALMAGRVAQLRTSVEQRNRELADAMRAMQRGQEDLTELQALTKLGTWSYDFRDGTAQWSDQMYRITGFDAAAGAPTREQWRGRVHPADRERYDAAGNEGRRNQARRSGGDTETETDLRLVQPGAAVIWVRMRRQSVKAGDGAITRQFGTLIDITAAKQSEQRLLMQHEVTKLLADAPTLGEAMPTLLRIIGQMQDWAVAACWRLSVDGTHWRCVDTWNLDEARLDAFSAGQRKVVIAVGTGRTGAFLLPAARAAAPRWLRDASVDPAYSRRTVAGQAGLRGAFALPVVGHGKVLRLLEFYSRDVRDPDPILIDLAQSLGNQIGQFVERRSAEAALAQARENLDMAVKASGIGFWDGDLASGALHYSGQFALMLGYQPGELAPKRAAFVERIHPDDQEPFYAAGVAGIKSGVAFVTELRLRHRDGSYRWFAGRAQAFYGANGRAVRMAGSLTDIEERKRLDRAKDEFVATVSHELRTPLTAIRGALGLLDGGVAGELPDDAKELVQVALSGSERLSRLVNDVLHLAKIESGADADVAEPLALDPLVDAAVKSNQPFCSQFGVRLQAVCAAPGALVQANPDRMMQVLGNLISNAAKFSPAGTGVCVTSTRHAGRLRLSVIDHGSGIPAQFRERIFQKFAQADGTDARAQQGSGLGLSICRALIEQMGGVIDFAATPGGGTTFFVDLPAAPAAVAGTLHNAAAGAVPTVAPGVGSGVVPSVVPNTVSAAIAIPSTIVPAAH